LRRVNAILDAPIEITERAGAVALPAVLPEAGGELRFENVTFSFGRGEAVLSAVSFDVKPGEVVAIVGPSGGGKSTVVDLALRHLDPDAGRVLLDGTPLTDLRIADVRRHIVAVEQEPFVFNTSIAENIRYARPDADREAIQRAAQSAGIAAFIERLPEGFDTMVGERGMAVSAGERQRIAIARAFLVDPAVLVLDEPTAALDTTSEAQVIEGYSAIMRGRTTIVISHRLELARKADRVIVLDRGRVVEEGPPEELLARRGAFYGLVAVE
jgi:ABC-type multidrug transport system fused ATPase/permease subunit